MEKQPQSHMHQKKKLANSDDICPICRESLYLDNEYTQRIGLIDDNDVVVGWVCPHCEASFDMDDKLTGLKGYTGLGEA